MGLIERWGSGTVRIIDELKKAGMPKPKFVSSAGKFTLIFYKQTNLESLIEKHNLSNRQIQAIEYVKTNGSISNSEYQSLTGISKRTASRELSQLLSKEIFLTGDAAKGVGKCYQLKKD